MSPEFVVKSREITVKIEFTSAVYSHHDLKLAAGRLKEFILADSLLQCGLSYILVSEGDASGD